MKKSIITTLFFGVILITSPAFAGLFGPSVVENAEKLFAETNFQMTVSVINRGLSEGRIDDSEKAKAYQILGQAYEKLGYSFEAKKAYRQAAVAKGTSYRTGQEILYLDLNNLEEIFPLLMKAALNNAELSASYGADIAQLAHNELVAGRLDNAKRLYDFSIQIDPDPIRQKEAFDYFFNVGKQKNGKEAEKYADKAAHYAGDKEAKEKLGKLYLKAAVEMWPNANYIHPKNKAIPLVGINFTKKVFPDPRSDILFKGNYSASDANEKGWVVAFETKKLAKKTKANDIIVIKAELPNKNVVTEKDFKVLDNDKWQPINNGSYTITLTHSLSDGKFYIKITNKDIKASVTVIRETSVKPINFEI